MSCHVEYVTLSDVIECGISSLGKWTNENVTCRVKWSMSLCVMSSNVEFLVWEADE